MGLHSRSPLGPVAECGCSFSLSPSKFPHIQKKKFSERKKKINFSLSLQNFISVFMVAIKLQGASCCEYTPNTQNIYSGVKKKHIVFIYIYIYIYIYIHVSCILFYHNCYVKKTPYINFTSSDVRVGEYLFKLLEWKRVTKRAFIVHSLSLIVGSHAISSIVLRSYQNLVDVSPACTFLTTYMKWNVQIHIVVDVLRYDTK